MTTGLALLLTLLPSGLIAPPDAAASAVEQAGGAGRRIDIELQDAEIHAVLELFGDIGRVNIVARRGVQGRVTAKFYDTPWDEVLAHILISLDLRMHREGNVITVMRAQR